jgi:excinuclease ABC subunit C
MNSQKFKKTKLPDLPGVYQFKKGKEILYIGKATSLRDRVRSYFSADLINTRGPIIAEMAEKAEKIDFIKTDSVLEALILEANLIKKHQPKYNTDLKDDKSFNYVVFTDEQFPRILIVREKDLFIQATSYHLQASFGPFPHGFELKEALKIIRRIFPFRDKCVPIKEKPLALRSLSQPSVALREGGGGAGCFNRQIGLCPGVCSGDISAKEYGKTIKNLKLFFNGKKKAIIKNLEKEMRNCAGSQNFEKAGEIKKQIFALKHIHDIALIKNTDSRARPNDCLVGRGLKRGLKQIESSTTINESICDYPCFRMEAYDVAHISGTSAVGVMVVFEEGEAKKSDYRKFKIKIARGGDDVGSLGEILKRRFGHKEWPFPDVIIVDGGEAQKKVAEEILKKFGIKNIEIIAVTKNDKHKPVSFLGDSKFILECKETILRVNGEAHRFAVAYHRRLRNNFFV